MTTPVLPPSDGRFPRRQRIMNLLEDAAIWMLGEALPQPERSHGGRPRHYPGWMYMVFDALIHEFGSAREAARELLDPELWALLRVAGERRYPNDTSKWLPETPMRRHHYSHAKRTFLLDDDLLESLGDVHRRQAAALAREVGLCDPEANGSLTHPSPRRVVYGDGKHIKPRFKTPPGAPPKPVRGTGEIRSARSDPDAEHYMTGGGEQVFGVRFVFLSVRGRDVNHRVLLDVIHAPVAGGEAKYAVAAFERTKPNLPGAQVALYDGALRGKHLSELYRCGYLPMARMTRAPGGRLPEVHYGAATVRRPDGSTEQVQIHLVHGAPHLKEIGVDGEPILTPLRRAKTSTAHGKRWYNEYEVPPEYGGGTVRLRLDSTKDDVSKSFNREEHLRAIPPEDEDYEALYALRNDAESGNRTLDDSMLRERAHSVGRRGIQLNVLTWSIYRNAQARALYGRARVAAVA